MRTRLTNFSVSSIVPVTVLVAWWIVSEESTSPFFPPLREILATFADVWIFDRIGTDLVPSLVNFGLGFAIAVVGGVVLGVVIGLSADLRHATDPVIDFLRSLPKPAIIPPAITLLGVGSTMKVFIIVSGAIWPVLLNTIDGVRSVDPLMLKMARVYGISNREQIGKLVIPAATPQIFVGARIALAIALILMVVSEMIAANNGLGYFVLLSQQTFAIREMWSGIFLLGIVGYLVNALFVRAEARALAWHRGWRRAALGEPTTG